MNSVFSITTPLLLTIVLALTAGTARAQTVDFGELAEDEIASLGRTAGLQYDIQFLIDLAQSNHAGPARPAYSPEFLEQASSLSAQVAELSDLQVLAGLMRLLAILDDGHTAIYGPGPDSPLAIPAATLPLRFYLFEEGLFVIDSQDEQAPHAGSKVLRLGELTPAQLMEEFAALRGSDNDMTLRWMGPQFFMHRMSNLLAIGASDTAESLDLRLQDRNGDVQQFTVAAGDYPMIRKLRASPVASGPVPLYLQNVDRNFWLTALEGARTLYFQFNQVRDSEQKSLAEFSAQLGQELKAGDIAYLVIDVRHNNGGNNRLLRPLLQQLIAFEQASADNRIFVITGRNTFSAAQNFINRLERWTDAVFVGEPSASSPNFVGEETPFTLPWSRVMGSLSDLYWQDSDPWDQRQWIAMDIPVPVTAADYFANRDAALEAVLAEIDSLASQAD